MPRVLRSRHSAILTILAAASILGLVIADDYGQSWDETYNDQAGAKAISAYNLGSFLRDQHDDYVHGTFYFMLFSGIPRSISSTHLGQLAIRHYLNYLTFLLAIASAYYLVDRMMGRQAGLVTALVMLGQPLYFGHAFINQKDIPFLAFFTASIALGVYATSAIEEQAKRSSSEPRKRNSLFHTLASIRAAWRQAPRAARVLFVLLSVLFAVLAAELLGEWIVYPLMENTLNQAYAQQAPESVNALFRAIAEDASKTPLETYQFKLQSAYTLLRAIAILLMLAALLMGWQRMIGPTHLRVPFVRDPAQRRLVLAGSLLGLTCAIRVIGPFAGMLAGLYMLIKLGRRAVPGILVYGLTAAAVTYLAWPALWGDPVTEFWSRLIGSARFAQPHEVFFEGAIIESSELPYYYLPKLLIIQFTLPMLVAVPVGLYLVSRLARRREVDGAMVILLVLWFGLPFLTQILLRVPLYGNIRQLLFITVPAAILAGVGWDSALRKLNRRWAQVLAVVLVLAPGVYHVIRFHPYEYVYYNELIGGVRGAEGSYLLDHWCTSYRELVEQLNLDAPPNARVAVWGPVDAAAGFARSDLIVEPIGSDWETASYRMACSRGLLDEDFFVGTQTLYEVRREGALLGRLAAITGDD
jgi:4-amino-4-deoxy-L-arabinose transferase-like glycosyltransferase